MIVRPDVTVIENRLEKLRDPESVTWTRKLNAPAVPGEPLSVPFGSRLTPSGKAPESTVQVYGGVPPEALRVWLYGVLTVALESTADVEILRGAVVVSIVSVNVLLACAPALSVTCAVKLKVPGAIRAPLSTPSPPSVNPAGADPDHLYGGVPPEAERA